jgi:putative transposase
MLYVRFPLALHTVEDLLHERGIDVSHETVRYWWHRFGPVFGSEIRNRRIMGMKSSRWKWQLDEIFVKINCKRHYLWRAVNHEGEVLESYVTKRRDKKAALNFLSKAMRKPGRPEAIVTNRLRPCGAALKESSARHRQETGRELIDRAENTHLPLPRRIRLTAPGQVHRACGNWSESVRHRRIEKKPPASTIDALPQKRRTASPPAMIALIKFTTAR